MAYSKFLVKHHNPFKVCKLKSGKNTCNVMSTKMI